MSFDVKAYKRSWYLKNKKRILVMRKKYSQDNHETILLKKKEYYRRNKTRMNAVSKEYSKKNKVAIARYQKIWYKNNKKSVMERTKNWSRNRNATNIQYRLTRQLRSRLNSAIKNHSKTGSAIRDLGCSIPELKIYLENKFQPGMSWENHSYRGWHIDHIIPLILFDLEDREQLLRAVHYTNLQPLWGKDNLKKGGRITH